MQVGPYTHMAHGVPKICRCKILGRMGVRVKGCPALGVLWMSEMCRRVVLFTRSSHSFAFICRTAFWGVFDAVCLTNVLLRVVVNAMVASESGTSLDITTQVHRERGQLEGLVNESWPI